MNISKYVNRYFKRFIPAPFTLAVLLSLISLAIAFILTGPTSGSYAMEILTYWQDGMWDPPLLVFAVQMMLILVLGHILVLSRPMEILTRKLTSFVNGNASAVILVSISTMLVSFFNWGLGLIFGAIMARKVGEASHERNFKINYPLVGAAGYVGLMVWHGGLSGSAPLKAAEEGHLRSLFPTDKNAAFLENIPLSIPTETSIFSSSNLILFGLLLVLVPLTLYLIAKLSGTAPVDLPKEEKNHIPKLIEGAERLNHSRSMSIGFGVLLLLAFFASYSEQLLQGSLTPNMLNFFMLGLGILMHGSFASFLKALNDAIGGAAAILIQFPLYFGIMGIMRETGLVTEISTFLTSIATSDSLPIYTFFSAGLVNIFVPSGGGQWAIQGPIVMESAIKLGVPLNKALMAFAYGDQITNMLQPFWALPLLAITRLKAREILPYTLVLLVLGTLTYVCGLVFL